MNYSNCRPTFLVGLVVSAFLLSSCSGSDGAAGSVGPSGATGSAGSTGPSGPPGGGGIPIDSAESINIEVTAVSVPSGGGAPVVSLRLTNDLTQGLVGLPASDIRFVISQLSPAPVSSGGSSEWQSYVTRSSAGIPNAQADTETATAGTFVDNDDGSYQYTFAQALTAYTGGPTYDESKSHRLGIEIRGQAPISSNGIFDFVPTGGAVTITRNIVDNDTCNACHDVLEFHGGPRTDVTYCVTCHNPSSIDGDTVDEAWQGMIDMKVMIHKIHYGHNLANGYAIVGYGGSVHDYSEIEFPQDVRNCSTCHDESDADTPEASNWRLVANRVTCGACHDDIDFANGGHPGDFTFTDDTQCLDCHGPDATVNDGDAQIPVAHAIPEQLASTAFQYNIVDVTNTGVGESPVIHFSVTDPTNGDAPYDIQNDAPFTTCEFGASRLAIGIAWDTDDYTNTDSGNTPAQPISLNPLTACGGTSVDEGGGVFSVISTTPVPASATGSAAITIDGHPAVDIEGTIHRLAVTNAVAYAAITDATPEARRNAVAIAKCDECHNQLSMHGNNRTDNPEVCVTCHNPNATDVNRRADACATDLGTDDMTIDMKFMIHAIHGSDKSGVPYEACGFGNAPHTFDFVYPGHLNNCEGCHLDGGYYPVDPAEVLGTTVDVGADLASPVDDTVVSPNSSVCSACHRTDLAKQHMMQNGGDFAATKSADSTLISAGVETCQLCHGPGRSADVKTVHGVGEFDFN
jgi:OmcA/MtrC family decaheme c-type cytochrome